VKTDADILGGETTYELRYNMPDESCKTYLINSNHRRGLRNEKKRSDSQCYHVREIAVPSNIYLNIRLLRKAIVLIWSKSERRQTVIS
jgi:hypothetical protein